MVDRGLGAPRPTRACRCLTLETSLPSGNVMMNPANSALVRWDASSFASAAVLTLALNCRFLWNRHQK